MVNIPTTKFYRPELDALRFLAFSLVFLYHTVGSAPGITGEIAFGGGYGVDLFFLLSAFLITELFMREKAKTNTINIPAFYRRRILRIWPLYFFFIAATFALSRFTPVQFPNSALIPMLFFYGNFYLMSHDFFSPGGILWSVSIEEQFYLLCPLVAAVLSRRNLLMFAIALLVVAIASRWILLYWFNIPSNSLQFCTPTRLDAIALGMATCLVLHGRIPTINPVIRTALLLGGLSGFAITTVWVHASGALQTDVGVMLGYPLAAFCALAIFLAFFGLRFAWRPVIYLGRISYGLYVYHLFALDVSKVFLLHALGTCPILLRGLLGIAITVPLAMLSYRYLETPFLRIKSDIRSAAAVIASSEIQRSAVRSP